MAFVEVPRDGGAVGVAHPRMFVATSDQTITGTTMTDVTGFSISGEADKTYFVRCYLAIDPETTTTGVSIQMYHSGRGSPSWLQTQALWPVSLGSSDGIAVAWTDYDIHSSGGLPAGNIEFHDILHTYAFSTAGTDKLQMAAGTVGEDIIIKKGSCMFVWEND